jgi:nucleoside-triphosphatase
MLIATVPRVIVMTHHRLFLTGQPGCGKTTVLRKMCKLLETRGEKVGGLVSGEIRENGVRVGFSLEDLLTKDRGVLAHVNQREGPRVGKYGVNLLDLERIGAAAIERALTEADIIAIDEVGPMELHSQPFISALQRALETPKPLICTIHKRASHPMVAFIKSNFPRNITEVTLSNRESLPEMLLERLSE